MHLIVKIRSLWIYHLLRNMWMPRPPNLQVLGTVAFMVSALGRIFLDSPRVAYQQKQTMPLRTKISQKYCLNASSMYYNALV